MSRTYARTRRELMYELWGRGLTNFDIMKEGPFYCCRVGKIIYATHIRTIGALGYDDWERRIYERYFPF